MFELIIFIQPMIDLIKKKRGIGYVLFRLRLNQKFSKVIEFNWMEG